jgi:hypothetical protein
VKVFQSKPEAKPESWRPDIKVKIRVSNQY